MRSGAIGKKWRRGCGAHRAIIWHYQLSRHTVKSVIRAISFVSSVGVSTGRYYIVWMPMPGAVFAGQNHLVVGDIPTTTLRGPLNLPCAVHPQQPRSSCSWFWSNSRRRSSTILSAVFQSPSRTRIGEDCSTDTSSVTQKRGVRENPPECC